MTFLYFHTKPSLAVFQEGLKMGMIDCSFNNQLLMKILDILDLLHEATSLIVWLTDAVET